MKKILLFVLTFFAFSAISFSQENDWRIHPDDAEYKIYGNFQTTFTDAGEPLYELTEVTPVGLLFPIQDKYYGGQTNHGNIFFNFDSITFAGSPDLDNIALWTYDETLDKWIADVETGKSVSITTQEMTVMLVLDCSSSLQRKGSNGLDDVKQSAISFIDVMLNASKNGNIHIGIIGFSSMKATRQLAMQPLTPSSADIMKTFINSFEQGNGTALYKSFDDAVDITKEYVKKLNNYAGSAIVTFTDGLDNGSINIAKRIGSKQSYFKYLQEDVLQQTIGGYPFQSYTIFVPGGDDIKDPSVETKIIEELKILARQDHHSTDHFFRVNSTKELDNQFRLIANSLIGNWNSLSCYISSGQNGKVCWTFGKQSGKSKTKKEDAPSLLGLNMGVGVPYGSYSWSTEFWHMGLNFQLGFDFAYPIKDNFALGCYVSAGAGFVYCEDNFFGYFGSYTSYGYRISAGILMEFGDLRESPFILGISPVAGFGESNILFLLPIEVRFGRVFSNNWYVMGELAISAIDDFYIEPSIRVGYNFGNKKNLRK
jgi:hypothetical protein